MPTDLLGRLTLLLLDGVSSSQHEQEGRTADWTYGDRCDEAAGRSVRRLIHSDDDVMSTVGRE